jgi:lipoic acid synthetase
LIALFEEKLFDTSPKKINRLPLHQEVGTGRFPSWLHRKLPSTEQILETKALLNQKRLHTVCEEAKCPNLLECWSRKTATFLALGKECTRACGFCDIAHSQTPLPLDENEPQAIVDSVKALKLKHVVITQVARDDLEDGGAHQMGLIVDLLREQVPDVRIELLTSDFAGNVSSWDHILEKKPDVFNTNIETVRSLSHKVRHKATYDRTLQYLSYMRDHRKNPLLIKSGLMVGLGETKEEVKETIKDLYFAGCSIITIGQYLQASHKKLSVKEFVPLELFKEYEEFGLSLGVTHMVCGPFVRSSYHADKI